MALSVATLAGFPAINTTLQRSAGTPTDAATFSFTNGVYTQGGTQYVAGIVDQQGINPSRIFFCDNNTGGGTKGATIALPTLVSVTQVSAVGSSLQELPTNYAGSSTYNEAANATGYAGFVVLLNAATPSDDSGGRVGGYYGGLNNQNNGVFTLNEVPGYTAQAPSKQYPNPQMRFFVSASALLILASTSTG
jgi:hypothetical protein